MSISSDPPKYIMVRNAIRESILNDQLASKSRLAPIAKMSVHFGVSPSVIQRALNDLVNDGFVECRGSCGYYVCGLPEKQDHEGQEISPNATREHSSAGISPVYLACTHHSDLVWCRTFEDADRVRKEQTRRLIEIAERNPEFHFFIEQAETAVGLPEFRTRLKTLLKTGQAELIGGMCIPDLNMISGETFLRSLLQGRADYRKYFGVETEIACLFDSFGMPFQVPQVLALSGYKYLIPGRLPNAPVTLDTNKPFRWNGANDSSILVSKFVMLNDIGYTTNLPVIYDPASRLKYDLEVLASSAEHSLAVFSKEEGLFDESFCRIVDQVNRESLREIRFARLQEYFESISEEAYPCYIGEFNPVFTGCYSTRIGNKQRLRRAENLMRRAEILAAAQSVELNAVEQNKELFRCAFHDAACGCCTDAAQKGILAKITSVISFAEKLCAPPPPKGKKFFIANTSGVKGCQLVSSSTPPDGILSERISGKYFFFAEMSAVGARSFRAGTCQESVKNVKNKSVKTGAFSVDFNGKYPRFSGAFDMFGDGFSAIRIRPDFGSMWTERFKKSVMDDSFSVEEPFTVTEGPLFYHAASTGHIVPEKTMMIGHTGKPWNGFKSLSWKKDFYFPKDRDFFLLKLTLDFAGRNTKVLIRFPHRLDPFSLERTDSVPFGSLARKPYYELESKFEKTMKRLRQEDYRLAMGDWPVLDWCDFADQHSAFAIANDGTPGCWSAGNDITFSLLRSGTAVEDGSLEPDPGAYDNGVHEYWFAFRVHAPGEIWKAAELGSILNRMPSETAPLPEGEWLSWDRENIALSCAERKDGKLILRFFEFCGKRSVVKFSGMWVNGKKLNEITPEGEFVRNVPDSGAVFAPGEIKTLSVE